MESTATALVTVKLTAEGEPTGSIKDLEVQEEDGYRELVCLACDAPLPNVGPAERLLGGPDRAEPEGLRIHVGLDDGDDVHEAYVFGVSYPHPVHVMGESAEFEEVALESDEDLARWADERFGERGWDLRDLS
jgi:hypothetical protein